MKKALILFTNRSVQNKEVEPEALIAALERSAEAQNIAMEYSIAYLDNLVHIINGTDTKIIDSVSGKDLSTYDVVYIRRWAGLPDRAMAVAIYLKKRGISCIDREACGFGSKNKMTQAWRFWEAGLPHPTTIYADNGVAMNWVLSHLQDLPFGFPMIVKGVEATRGADNYLVHSARELDEVVRTHTGVQFLIQAFVPNDGDYRVIVCGNDVQLVMQRVAPEGKHTNNTSQGGQAKLVSIDTLAPEVRDDCIRAAQIFGRDFAGVDLVYHKDTGKHLFFEVNRSPQIESGQYVEEKVAVLTRYLQELSV